ncbi:MAG: hypothetical protein H5T86_15030, partial [Armatimonadetes bacterium]|nr:hypothetical protein [Armatimonadota bacterium]
LHSGTAGAGLVLGLLAAAVLYNHWRWAAARPRLPRRLFPPRGHDGLTLPSAIASIALMTIVMAISVQLLATVARARQASLARLQALATAATVLEQARVGAVGAPTGRSTSAATLSISPGPFRGTVTLTAAATIRGQTVYLSTVAPAGRSRLSTGEKARP